MRSIGRPSLVDPTGLVALVAFLCLAASAGAADIVFHGTPTKKITITADGAAEEPVVAPKADEFSVTIVREGDAYFWTSRENKPLSRSESGSYITFHATDGSGYVRVYQPQMYDLMDKLPPAERAHEVGYMEHIVHQFASITYFGDKR